MRSICFLLVLFFLLINSSLFHVDSKCFFSVKCPGKFALFWDLLKTYTVLPPFCDATGTVRRARYKGERHIFWLTSLILNSVQFFLEFVSWFQNNNWLSRWEYLLLVRGQLVDVSGTWQGLSFLITPERVLTVLVGPCYCLGSVVLWHCERGKYHWLHLVKFWVGNIQCPLHNSLHKWRFRIRAVESPISTFIFVLEPTSCRSLTI